MKAKNNLFAGPLIAELKDRIAFITNKTESLAQVSTTIQVEGNHYFSKADLETHNETTKEVWKIEKDITTKLTALTQLSKLVPP